jgi:hypothetical protein
VILQDHRTAVCPFIDVVDYNNMEYRAQDEGARGAFDWQLYYKRQVPVVIHIQNVPSQNDPSHNVPSLKGPSPNIPEHETPHHKRSHQQTAQITKRPITKCPRTVSLHGLTICIKTQICGLCENKYSIKGHKRPA